MSKNLNKHFTKQNIRMVNKHVIRYREIQIKTTVKHYYIFILCTYVQSLTPLSMRFPKHRYWSVLPFTFKGDLTNPGFNWTYVSCLAGRFFTTEPPGKPTYSLKQLELKRLTVLGFLGDPVVKNLPANAGGTDSSLVPKDSMCPRTTKPMCHNYWARALEPTSHNHWAQAPQLRRLHAAFTEASTPKAHAPQQEKPLQWEVWAPQLKSSPLSQQLEKSLCVATKTQHSQK